MTDIEERQLLSGLRAAEERHRAVARENARLKARLEAAESRLKLRLTARQTRAILDENDELRRMNGILLERNTALARKQRRQRPARAL